MRSSPMGKGLAAITAFALMFITLAPFASMPVYAQAQAGTIRGVVTDNAGGVVAGATVKATNQATGSTTSGSTTNSDGAFEIPGLLPGPYTISVEAPNFKRSVTNGFDVKVGVVNALTIKLEAGNIAETVTVTSNENEVIQRDQSQISNTFEARKIQDLPSNGAGAGLDTIALLAPGVIANNVGGTNTNGTGLSVNGNRGRSNNFQIDGSDNNDLTVAGPALFVDNQSQVAEYQIVTNNFSAQYGRNQGAVVNIVTKTGSNQFHGDLFEFTQNAAHLNSLDNIQRASGQLTPNQSIYNVFGGTVGGPVWLPAFGEGGKSVWKGKDRAFFFFSYQGIRNPSTFTSGTTNTSLSILPGESSRLLSTFPGNPVIADIATLGAFQSPLGTAFVHPGEPGSPTSFNLAPPSGCPKAIAAGSAAPSGCGTYTTFINPATGQPFLTGGAFDVINLGTAGAPQLFQAAQIERNVSTPFTEDAWSIRFTVKATEKDNIDVRYLYQSQLFGNNLVGVNGFSGDVPAVEKNLGGTWTRQISNNKVNEFRATTQSLDVLFGGSTQNLGNFEIPSPSNIASTVTNIAFGALGVTKPGSALLGIGGAANLPQGRLVKVYQIADNLTYTRGKQSFIFGAEYKHLTNNVPFLPDFQGVFSYSNGANSLARVLNNAPSAITIAAGNPVTIFAENDQYYFVQDDFKVKSNLTLNLGVRYEYTGQPINQLHDATVARESNSATAIWNPNLPLSVRTVPFIKPDRNNFAPRLGFAYTPHFWKKILGEDATVIRGGFSIAYDPAFYNILLNLQNAAPYSALIGLGVNTGLASTTTSPLGLPGGVPTATTVQAKAAASGILPLGKLNPLLLSQTTVASDFRSPYSEQWSFGIQHQINRSNVFEVRYVGTHGIGLFQSVNGNPVVAPLVNGLNLGGISFPSFKNLVPTGLVAQACGPDNPATVDNEAACNGRQFAQGSLTVRQNSGQSIYHALQSQYTGRFLKNSMTFSASYTFSKTIDNASEIFSFGDNASPNAENFFCTGKCERSLSDLDRPHAFSLSLLYDIPFFKEQHGFVGHVLGGWQANGIYVLTSGAPYTPSEFLNGSFGLGNTYLTSGDRPFLTNSKIDPGITGISQIDAALLGICDSIQSMTGFYSLNQINTTGNCVPVGANDVHFVFAGPGAAKIFNTPFGTAQRNSLRGPMLNQLNASMFKNTKIGERVTVQFRAEAFNVLNHPNPGYGVGSGGFLPDIFVEDAGAPGSRFANNSDIELAHRTIQFGLRIIF